MATFSDAIEKTRMRLMPVQPMQLKIITSNYTAASGTITLDFNSQVFAAVQTGVKLDTGRNVLLVTGPPNTSTGVTPVVGGIEGSTDANATIGDLVGVGSRFNRWDISQAIIEEILSLDPPSAGLGQVKVINNITYIPVFLGYDLGAGFDTYRSRVLEVSYKIAPPFRTYPLIRRGDWRVIRHADTSVFPNGSAIVIYKPGWPGFPITVQYLAPFVAPVNLTDDLATVSGVQANLQDIVYMGAMQRLAPDREISRNSTERQPDPRKAIEVPAGATQASANSNYQRYLRRRNEEASVIKRAYPQSETLGH